MHGGAGDIDRERHGAARQGCRRAVEAGLAVLASGGSALDAAQAAVRVLEDDPSFNAGTGSVLTRAGTVEMDAAVMDGRTLGFGAVAAVPNAGRAIELARAVLDDGEHILLCGEGAWAFARERGFAPGDPATLITERARRRFEEAAARGRSDPDWRADPGTVGACATDADGNVASATSTGGICYKRVGRIGDTPLPGCGTYADNLAGAASATGHGEAIARVQLALLCVNEIRDGRGVREAAQWAVDEMGVRVSGKGGVICIDRYGRFGAAHNSANMAYAAGVVGIDELIDGVELGREADLNALYRRK